MVVSQALGVDASKHRVLRVSALFVCSLRRRFVGLRRGFFGPKRIFLGLSRVFLGSGEAALAQTLIPSSP
jgi:hypothetical protein